MGMLILILLSILFGFAASQGYQQGRQWQRPPGGGGWGPPGPPPGPPPRSYPGRGGYYGYNQGYNGYGGCGSCCNQGQPCNDNFTFPTALPTYPSPNSTAPFTVPPSRLPPIPNNASTPSAYFGPPVALPNNSVLFPNGTVGFPNATLLLTRYSTGAIPPAARTPAGYLVFANGTVLSPRSTGVFPPPGIPLNSTVETTIYPPVLLPNNTLIFFNGTLLPPGLSAIQTVFIRGACVGLSCHHWYYG